LRYQFGAIAIDTDARQLLRAAQPVHLSPKAFELLEVLIAQRPRAVPKQELYDHLWPSTFVVDANLPVLIREIRAAIGDRQRAIIRTVHRFGYSFAADLRETNAEREEGDGAAHMLIAGDKLFRLGRGDNAIGRDPSSAVCIQSSTVSRSHAVITVRGEEAVLTDLGSKNGTAIDGKPLHGSASLRDGSAVRFGAIEMTYRCSYGLVPTETL
jgi:DNA-binding winged helix-turn-helix (wHTH) protein